MNLFLPIVCFILFGLVGIKMYYMGKDNKVPLHNTPWSESDSWLIYAALMFSLVNSIILNYKLMMLGG